MVSSDKAACAAAPPSNPPMDNNNRFAPVDTQQKKAPKCANKKAKLDIWTRIPTILGVYFQHHPASFTHPLSLIAFIPLSSVVIMHAKQEEVLLPAAIAHSPFTVASYFIFLHPYIFADPTSTYSACTPPNGLHRMCFNLVLPPTFHPGNRLPGLSMQINRNGIQFEKKSLCALQDPSLILSYHVFIELLHSSFSIRFAFQYKHSLRFICYYTHIVM